MQHLYPGVVWRMPSIPSIGAASLDNKHAKNVYLTFDDGPIPDITPAILDILAQYNVKATFFMVGDNVVKYPHIYNRVVAEGHRVGNHTFHHIKGLSYSLDAYIQDIKLCEQAIAQATSSGVYAPSSLFRPPYGKITFKQKKAIREMGYKIILWDVLTHDYNSNYSADKMVQIVQQYTREGSIINFHDSIKTGHRTLDALGPVIQWLLQQGYTPALL